MGSSLSFRRLFLLTIGFLLEANLIGGRALVSSPLPSSSASTSLPGIDFASPKDVHGSLSGKTEIQVRLLYVNCGVCATSNTDECFKTLVYVNLEMVFYLPPTKKGLLLSWSVWYSTHYKCWRVRTRAGKKHAYVFCSNWRSFPWRWLNPWGSTHDWQWCGRAIKRGTLSTKRQSDGREWGWWNPFFFNHHREWVPNGGKSTAAHEHFR